MFFDYDKAEFRLGLINELISEITCARVSLAELADITRADKDGLSATLLLVADHLGERANWLGNQAALCSGTPMKPSVPTALLRIGAPGAQQ